MDPLALRRIAVDRFCVSDSLVLASLTHCFTSDSRLAERTLLAAGMRVGVVVGVRNKKKREIMAEGRRRGAWPRRQRYLLALLLLSSLVGAAPAPARAAPQVPCYFVFGDSLVDSGNNNVIVSLARANYPPYGIDFAGGPTGRFSNGLTTVDVISKLLGFNDFIPPFAGATSEQLLTGVNFASAAAGIREETGQQLGGRISFSGQIENYKSAVRALVSILGDERSAAARLSRCVFTVGMGSNDYLNNYFMPAFYATGSAYTPEQYADVLAAQYSRQLQVLYAYGARKVALMGVGQVGCSPNELATVGDGVGCVERINAAVRMFNARLVKLVDEFNGALPGARFTYVNVYGIFEDILRSPAGAHGLKVTDRGCCGVGRNNGQVTCLPFQLPCANRHEYLFWDAFHPTEAANVLVGQRIYSARLKSDVHPVDILTLARL